MDGCYEKIPCLNFDEVDLEIIGKVITQAFIQHNLFPVELSKASLKHYIFGTASEEELLSSFLKFLTSYEAYIITKFRESKTLEDQPILDILNEYSMFHHPTPSNIMALLAKAAKIVLVKLLCFAMQGLTRGMGPFWEKLEENVFDSMYGCTIPTSAKVIESIDAVERSAKDGKVTKWLNRYIRNCSKHRLLQFIRSVTGSSNFSPNTHIKLQFVDQTPPHLSPFSKMCFKILILPRQYTSFTHLKDNIDTYLSNEENWVIHDMF